MRLRLSILLTLSVPVLHAQLPAPIVAPAPLAGTEASVQRKSGPPTTERILSGNAGGVSLLMLDGRSTIKVPYDQIDSIRFSPPAGWEDIAQSIKQGKIAEAEAKMLPFATRMAPLTVVKSGDAAKYVFAYTDVLRSLGKYQAAYDFLEKTPFPKDAPVVDRARWIIVEAYCQAMLGKLDEADKMLNQIEAPGDKSSLFTIYQLARARVDAQQKDQISCLDDIAHVLALKRLGSESYDEALYQSAEAYDALGKALADQKAVVAKDERLKRQMQQDNLDAITRFDIIKADPLQVAAVWDASCDYAKCATSARLQLCRVYPNSPWTVKAREKLPANVKKMLSEEAGRNAETTAKESVAAGDKDKPVADASHKDRTNPAKTAPKEGVLKLDETTQEKEGP